MWLLWIKGERSGKLSWEVGNGNWRFKETSW